jgi:hypothetical protein
VGEACRGNRQGEELEYKEVFDDDDEEITVEGVVKRKRLDPI